MSASAPLPSQAASPSPGATAQSQGGSGPAIEISGLNKWYGDFHVLKNIDLTVARGEKKIGRAHV